MTLGDGIGFAGMFIGGALFFWALVCEYEGWLKGDTSRDLTDTPE